MDLGGKVEKYKQSSSYMDSRRKKHKEDELEKVTSECSKAAITTSQAMTLEILKDMMFNKN